MHTYLLGDVLREKPLWPTYPTKPWVCFPLTMKSLMKNSILFGDEYMLRKHGRYIRLSLEMSFENRRFVLLSASSLSSHISLDDSPKKISPDLDRYHVSRYS